MTTPAPLDVETAYQDTLLRVLRAFGGMAEQRDEARREAVVLERERDYLIRRLESEGLEP